MMEWYRYSRWSARSRPNQKRKKRQPASLSNAASSVLVDIGQPPTRRLTAFNAYVALSQSSGKDTIQLIR
ncbi:hypothetical protein BS47DRAFT_1348234, partial [Hydnum rufescens UP504]